MPHSRRPIKRTLTGRIVEGPNASEYDRFQSLASRLARVPKKEIDSERATERRKNR